MIRSLNYNTFWKGNAIVERRNHPLRTIADAHRNQGDKTLEIGPGTRPTVPVAGTYFLDNAASAIEQLRVLGGIGVVGDASHALPYEDSSFDVVCAFDVLEHLEDDARACQEIARVLKPGGRFIFSVPMRKRHWTAFDQFIGHWRRYEPETLARLFQENGLVVEQLFISSSPWFSTLVAFRGTKAFASVASSLLAFFPILRFFERGAGVNLLQRFIAPLHEFSGGLSAVPSSVLRACIVCRKDQTFLRAG